MASSCSGVAMLSFDALSVENAKAAGASSNEELLEGIVGDAGKKTCAPPGFAGEGERERIRAARPAAMGSCRRPCERVFGRVGSLIDEAGRKEMKR